MKTRKSSRDKSFLEDKIMKKWKCTICGEIIESETCPETCPLCKAPGEKFVEVKEDGMTLAAEHIVGIAKDAPEAIKDGLRADFNGEIADKIDPTAFFRIGYGLYVVTSNDGEKDNGLIVNTVFQVTNTPNRIAVCINKQNYSHHIIRQTGIMNVNCLSVEAPFSVFEAFGFRSGRTVDKFADTEPLRSDNGLVCFFYFIE